MDARELFAERFGSEPDALARAPGRVDLIGAHLDYTLLPVIPVALQHGVTVAARSTGTGRLRAVSADFEGFLDVESGAADAPPGWHRYVWAAAREAGSHGADIAVAGDLVADGGLSSSSALTVALLAALTGLQGDALVLAASRAERSVGIEGGLMDQTVIVHATAGTALRIEFDPLAHRAVPVPEDLRIVAAFSGEAAPKSAVIRDAFDERVAGGRIAAAIAGDALGLDPGRPPLLGRVARAPGIDAVVAELPETMAPRAAPAAVDDIVQLTARRLDAGVPVPVRAVAEHVVGEMRRVDAVEEALDGGDLAAIGAVFDASHRSMARYGAATAGLDGVCAAMRAAGALGARIAGAGWGGFGVAAARPDTVEAVISAAIRSGGGPAFEVVPSAGMSR